MHVVAFHGDINTALLRYNYTRGVSFRTMVQNGSFGAERLDMGSSGALNDGIKGGANNRDNLVVLNNCMHCVVFIIIIIQPTVPWNGGGVLM